MKYMGSKRGLLSNGLGELLVQRSQGTARVVDLFSGSAAISWYLACRIECPILAVDLQQFSRVLAAAVICRTRPVSSELLVQWTEEAERRRQLSRRFRHLKREEQKTLTARHIRRLRRYCAEPSMIGPVWNSYGGYYFSPSQALTFDYLLKLLPERRRLRDICLAALIITASRCAAAPGHTAQPFKPTPRALPYIHSAWRRDPIALCREALTAIAAMRANRRGTAIVEDAGKVGGTLNRRDLVILDPPYSSAQYSRFYHVLETIAKGHCGPVSGAGRYPPADERPRSDYSLRTSSTRALRGLLADLGERGCGVVITFPQFEGSNGLRGEDIIEMAREWYRVDVRSLTSSFSTLGGNGRLRAARRRSRELLISLYPK